MKLKGYYQLRHGRGLDWNLVRHMWKGTIDDVASVRQQFWQKLSLATPVDVEPIEHILFGKTRPETGIFPAWPVMWFEVRVPPNPTDVESRGPKFLEQLRRYGADKNYRVLWGYLVEAHVLTSEGTIADLVGGYAFSCWTVSWFVGEKKATLGSVFEFACDKDGTYYRLPGVGQDQYAAYGVNPGGKIEPVTAGNDTAYDVCLILKLLSFLQAKNIRTRAVPFPQPGNHRIHGGIKRPVYRYHELVVVKPGESVTGQSSDRKDQSQGIMPVHLVRGHLREYKERPLFGKYFGTFYIPSHIRGDKERGVVEKTYALKEAANHQ